MRLTFFSLLILTSMGCAPRPTDEPDSPAELSVTSDFEGGSARVESINRQSRVIRFKPEPYPDKGWAYWWFMRVDGIRSGETIVLDVGGKHGRFAHPEQAAFSTDGEVWRQTAPGERRKERIVYRVKVDAETAWFAWAPPFLRSDAAKLVERVASESVNAEAFELCKSRDGLPVPAIRIRGEGPAGETRYGIWIQARQHAWECGSSWVAAGLLEWLVSDDPKAKSLLKKADITLVPIMDVDSVAMGAGGKAQKPHDHNRDWVEAPYWPEVRAAQEEIQRVHQRSGLDLFIDLHSPGMYDPETYYLTSPGANASKKNRDNLQRFLKASRAEITGELGLRKDPRVADGAYTHDWDRMSQNWATRQTSAQAVAVTLEVAWNNPQSTAAGYMDVGRKLGLAMERYLRQDPR